MPQPKDDEDDQPQRLDLTTFELQEMLEHTAEKAADKAAQRTLERLGLNDAEAEQDMHNLRSFFKAMRYAKRTILKSIIYNVVDKGVTVAIVYFMVKLGLHGIDPKDLPEILK